MGKKTKTGKGRLDKFYHLAKDQGYRARSAFKLIQLAKKQDFLSSAQVCIDLCGAPGGWSQVAQKNMPFGSQILCIDLAPIKPIHGVVCIQADITTQKCRELIKKELKGKGADVVLNDGAPNVGASWAKDAFSQAELTLSATKIACEHLKSGGTFVTKVFRSADYNSLLWVFTQLFSKVDATKPTASRNVSAEIFVICSGYKAPGKVDPRFFEPNWVFIQVESEPGTGGTGKSGASLSDHLKSQKKKNRSGYEEGDDMKIAQANDFLEAKNPAEVLVTHHKMSFEGAANEALARHASTTDEIRELCVDLKILGKRDLAHLLKWRIKILREREKEDKEAKKLVRMTKSVTTEGKDGAEGISDAEDSKGEGDDSEDEAEADINEDLNKHLQLSRKEEKTEAKKKRAKEKKMEMRKKMSLGNNLGADEPDLFKHGRKSADVLEEEDKYIDPRGWDSGAEASGAEHQQEEDVASDSDSEDDRLARMEVDLAVAHELTKLRNEQDHRNQMQRLRKKKKETRRQLVHRAWAGEMVAFNKTIDEKAYQEHMLKDKEDSDDDDDDDDDLAALRDEQQRLALGDREESALALKDEAANGDEDASKSALALPDSSRQDVIALKRKREVDETRETIRAGTRAGLERASRWFGQEIFFGAAGSGDEESGEDMCNEVPNDKLPQLPLTDKEKRKLKRKKDLEKLERLGKKPKVENAEPVEVADQHAPVPLTAPLHVALAKPQKPSDPQELAETLALGSMLVESKKSRMDMIDAAYNRWTFDGDEALPDWFVEEESKFNKPELPVSKELMDQFRAKMKEINARPIRKVLEARARKKKRLAKRIEKLRKTAVQLSETGDMSEAAKARQMRQMLRKAKNAETNAQPVSFVAVRKGGGGRKLDKSKVPRGAKVKVVDKRMKSDLRGQKKAAKSAKGKRAAKKQQRSLNRMKQKAGGSKNRKR